MKTLARVFVGWLAMWFGVIAGAIAGNWLSSWLAAVTTACAVLFILACVLRHRFRWGILDFVAAYVVGIPTALAVISHFSGCGGNRLFDWFNIWWLTEVGTTVGTGWFAGLLVGSYWPSALGKASRAERDG